MTDLSTEAACPCLPHHVQLRLRVHVDGLQLRARLVGQELGEVLVLDVPSNGNIDSIISIFNSTLSK